jgi:hypothetical protein
MSQYHDFKEAQFAPRLPMIDPLGLAPKTVALEAEE